MSSVPNRFNKQITPAPAQQANPTGQVYQSVTSKPELPGPGNTGGANGRAQQGNLPPTRQAGPIHSNKPLDNLFQLILPATGNNRVTAPAPENQGGPISNVGGDIWPRIDYSENLQLSAPAANFTVSAFNTFAAQYVHFAVPHTLPNRKLYAYVNIIAPNVGAFAALIANINLWKENKIKASFPLAIYNGANNNNAAPFSSPFVCGTGLAGYDSIGVSLRSLQAGETSPVSLVPLICAINIDRISVDLDTVNSTPLNLSSIRIWVGCISY